MILDDRPVIDRLTDRATPEREDALDRLYAALSELDCHLWAVEEEREELDPAWIREYVACASNAAGDLREVLR